MVKGRQHRPRGRPGVQHLGEHKGRAGRRDVDAVAHHGAREDRVAEAGAGPHLGDVEGAGGEGGEAEPGEVGPALAGAAAAPEAG